MLLFDRKLAIIYYDPSVRTLEIELEKQNIWVWLAVLRYATECIRPDIADVVKLLCKFTSRWMRSIVMLLERVMRCLKKTMTLGLLYEE